MELRHLRYFLAVVDEQNFGRAAEKLFISQSTLSEQIQSLEREVGGPLLTRTSRRVELTDAGRLLLPEARRAISQTDHALRQVRAATAGELGSIRIGFSGAAALSGVLGDDLREFRARHPKVDVELVEAAPSALLDQLRNGVVDVAYAPDLGHSDDVLVRERTSVPRALAVPRDHPLAALSSVSLSDLAREPLIAVASEHDVWTATLLADVAADRLTVVPTILGALALASAGVSVAVVPSDAEVVGMPGVVFVPLTDAGAIVVVIAVRRGDPSATVRELLRISE